MNGYKSQVVNKGYDPWFTTSEQLIRQTFRNI